jgi:hypothetical protein
MKITRTPVAPSLASLIFIIALSLLLVTPSGFSAAGQHASKAPVSLSLAGTLATPALTTTFTKFGIVAGGSDADSSILTGGVTPTGTITFYTYTDSACTKGQSQVGSQITVSGNGDYGPSQSVGYPSAGTYYWNAAYSGDSNNYGVTSPCETLTVIPPAPGLTSPPAAVCSIPTLFNLNSGWLSVDILIVLLAVILGGVIYAVSNILPVQRGERLKRITKFEIFQAFLSIIIIVALFGMSALACGAGALLVQQTAGGASSYTGASSSLFTYSDNYLGTLLFTNGVSLVSTIYTQSVNFVIASNVFIVLQAEANTFLPNAVGHVALSDIVSLSPDIQLSYVLKAYSDTSTGLFSALLVISFAPMLIIFLLLPIIQASALVVIVPVALVMRSLSFVGPKIREASNLFLAIAIGFYFILPLTIVFNSYVASCLGINIASPIAVACRGYPLAQYAQGYSFPAVPTSLFTSSGAELATTEATATCTSTSAGTACANQPFIFGIPASQIFQSYAGGPITSGAVYGQTAGDVLNSIWNAPQLVVNIGAKVAAYMFLGIVMLALDLAITVGFINGLGKGLNSMSSVFGVEPLFGD